MHRKIETQRLHDGTKFLMLVRKNVLRTLVTFSPFKQARIRLILERVPKNLLVPDLTHFKFAIVKR